MLMEPRRTGPANTSKRNAIIRSMNSGDLFWTVHIKKRRQWMSVRSIATRLLELVQERYTRRKKFPTTTTPKSTRKLASADMSLRQDRHNLLPGHFWKPIEVVADSKSLNQSL
jgi:hypothetical protein